jgi:prephenate dehydratase
MSESVKRVAIQGIAGAFHELAAHRHFGNNITIVECDTFKEVCRKLSTGEVDFAVMAIENTIAGTLLQNYSLINNHQLKIIGEVYLQIQMQLMALPGVSMKDIEFVHSHPIAIAQTREFLDTLPPRIQVVETNDTAESAKQIVDKGLKNTAAVAGANVAEMYNLNILANDIHTHKQNFTRFLILSTEGVENPTNNKASLCFEVAHKSGSLAEVLTIWAHHGINLTKIQSVPIIGKPYQYWFYVDLVWDDYHIYRHAINMTMEHIISLSVLGEYEQKSFNIVK